MEFTHPPTYLPPRAFFFFFCNLNCESKNCNYKVPLRDWETLVFVLLCCAPPFPSLQNRENTLFAEYFEVRNEGSAKSMALQVQCV